MAVEGQSAKPWTRRKKLVVGLLCSAAVIGVAVLAPLTWIYRDANRTFHGFIDALVANDYQRAYTFTSRDLRAVTDYNTFLKVNQGLIQREGALRGAEVDEGEIKEKRDGWRGTFDTELIFERGRVEFIFHLKKEDGVWKILSYQEQ